MLRKKKNSLIFFLSNILFFLTILFTYLDLSKYNIADTILPNEFSLKTYFIIILFLITLFTLINKTKDKFKIFCIFVYYLILSSGVYVLNFPIMDELILITSSFYFFISLSKKKIFLQKNQLLFFIILLILFIQSIVGLFSDIRSARYIFIFLSLLITYIYFSDLDVINDNDHKIFFSYIFSSVILYLIYQFFFWYLKFYIFEMKFPEQTFIGDMQPAFAKSASGHMDAILFLSGYLILFFSINSNSVWKIVTLFISIFLFSIFSDARSSLFILFLTIFFYFFTLKNFKKIFFIFLILLIFIQKDFDNPLNKYLFSEGKTIEEIVNIQTGSKISTPVYQTDQGGYFYEAAERPVYGDFGRLSFVLAGLTTILDKPIQIFFGCGFYNYYNCAEESLIYIHEKFNVKYDKKFSKFGNQSQIRPTAAGTILVENGWLVILILSIVYLDFLIKNIFRKNNKCKTKKILISLYLVVGFISWSIISSLLDIIFFYLFLLPIFRKILFYKI
jgi:hypothetical protein